MLFFLFSKFKSQFTESYQLSPDGQVIEQLKQAGSDITQPHKIEFFFFIQSAAGTNRIVKYLESKKFEVQFHQSEEHSDWAVKATKEMIPDENKLILLRSEFETISLKEGGSYDGWGTSIVK
jgi:hypothetical protein